MPDRRVYRPYPPGTGELTVAMKTGDNTTVNLCGCTLDQAQWMIDRMRAVWADPAVPGDVTLGGEPGLLLNLRQVVSAVPPPGVT